MVPLDKHRPRGDGFPVASVRLLFTWCLLLSRSNSLAFPFMIHLFFFFKNVFTFTPNNSEHNFYSTFLTRLPIEIESRGDFMLVILDWHRLRM